MLSYFNPSLGQNFKNNNCWLKLNKNFFIYVQHLKLLLQLVVLQDGLRCVNSYKIATSYTMFSCEIRLL